MYGCGDVCIDMNVGNTRRSKCPFYEGEKAPRIFEGDVVEGLKTIKDDSSVVFECELFDYVTDFPGVLRELSRITGGDIKRSFHTHIMGAGSVEDAWQYHLGVKKPSRPTDSRVEAEKTIIRNNVYRGI